MNLTPRLSALLLLAWALLLAPNAAVCGARETKATQAGEVVVVLNEQIFNALLEALFALPQPPTFPLSGGGRGGACASQIVLARQMDGARTAVRFRDGRIAALVAFRGSYAAPVLGCVRFQGWADSTLELAFEAAKQALVARLRVTDVHLSKVPSLFASGVTGLVQDALDERVNPVEILRAEQLSAQLPLRKLSAGGSLRLRAREVRHEVSQKELRLRIVYEFVRED